MQVTSSIRRQLVAIAAASTLNLAACRPDSHDATHSHGHGHGHDHGHAHPHESESEHQAPDSRTASITIWQGGYEIFLEHPYVVQNTEVEFITHVSRLAEGTPRRSGAVTLVFTSQGGEELRHQEDDCSRPGIYLPSLTLPSAGDWRLRLEIPKGEGSTSIRLGVVRVFETQEDADAATAPDEIEGVTFLKEQQWTLGMKTAVAESRNLVARRGFPARVRAKRGRRVTISSPVRGRLVEDDATRVLELGDRVEADQVLATIVPTLASTERVALEVGSTEAEAAELRARTALELAESNLARQLRLESTNATSRRHIEQARFDVESAKTSLAAAIRVRQRYSDALAAASRGPEKPGDDREDENQRRERWQLRAPIAGVIVEASDSPGSLVQPDENLFVVLDSSTVRVEASIPEHEAGFLENAPTAYLEIDTPDATTVRLDLEHRHSALEVDEKTRTVSFFYEVSNPDGRLRVGATTRAYVELAPASSVLSIPTSALVDEDGRDVVFVQVSGETFEKRYPSLGIRDRGFVEVRSGISTGERVAATDAWSIRLASLSSGIPAHTH